MDEAERAQKRVYETLLEARECLNRDKWKKTSDSTSLDELKTLSSAFLADLDDDCNTAAAIGHIFAIIHLVRNILEDKSKRTSELGRDVLTEFLNQVKVWDQILGVFGMEPNEFLIRLKKIRMIRKNIDINYVEDLLQKRADARANKNFAESDLLREQLKATGVEVRDTPAGQQWDLD